MTEQANEQQDTGVVSAVIQNATDDDLVSVVLAHPLPNRDKERLGLPVDALCGVNTTVRVLQTHARTLIAAGYAQVDPEDKDAVRAVLRGDQRPVETQGSAEAPQAGEGTDADAGGANPSKAQQAAQGNAGANPVGSQASADPAAPAPVAAAKASGTRGTGGNATA